MQSDIIKTLPNTMIFGRSSIVLNFSNFSFRELGSGLLKTGRIEIEYFPNKKIIEKRSFEIYLSDFGLGHFTCEAIVNKISADIVNMVRPHACKVIGHLGAITPVSMYEQRQQ